MSFRYQSLDKRPQAI